MIGRANRRFLSRLGRPAVAALALALAAPHAIAQDAPAAQQATGQGADQLPAELVRQAQLPAADLGRVQAYASRHLANLEAEDASVRESARADLIDPLLQSPSPSFRIAYGSLVKDAIERLARAGDEDSALFAMQLAGRLATVDAHALVLRTLDDERPAIRYAAARAARLQLDSMHPGPAALNTQHRDALVDALVARVRVERDRVVLDGLLTTASEAVRRETPWAPAFLEKLASVAPDNLRGAGGSPDRLAEARAYLRLVGSAQQYFRQNLRSVPENLAHESALLAGHAIGYVDRAVEQGPDPAAVEALGQLIRAAHTLAFFAHTARTGQQLTADEALPRAFDRWRETGNASDLHREVERWIGPGGILTRAPYDADPDVFLHG